MSLISDNIICENAKKNILECRVIKLYHKYRLTSKLEPYSDVLYLGVLEDLQEPVQGAG